VAVRRPDEAVRDVFWRLIEMARTAQGVDGVKGTEAD
jgi:hypothetical protein